MAARFERFGLLLRGAQQHVDVRLLSASSISPVTPVRRFLAELTENDRRRAAEIANRSELEVEEDGDRDGDGDGQAAREPEAAISKEMPEERGADASAGGGGVRRVHRLKLTRILLFPSRGD